MSYAKISLVLLLGLALGANIVSLLASEPEPVAPAQGYVQRALWLRIEGDMDKLSRSHGDRYRKFECREVSR